MKSKQIELMKTWGKKTRRASLKSDNGENVRSRFMSHADAAYKRNTQAETAGRDERSSSVELLEP